MNALSRGEREAGALEDYRRFAWRRPWLAAVLVSKALLGAILWLGFFPVGFASVVASAAGAIGR